MSWILKNFRIQVHGRKFLREHMTLRDSLIICILFGSNQPLVPLKIRTAAFLIREMLAITPTNLLKQDLTYLSNASQGSFYLDFCRRECISCLLIKYSKLTSINYMQNRNLYNQTNAGKVKKGSSILLSLKIHLCLKCIEIDWSSVIDVFHYALIQIS